MNVLKKITVVALLSSMLCLTVNAEETKTVSFITTVEDENVSIVETDTTSEVNNAALLVRVIKYVNDVETVIYEGPLGNYDNGLWNYTDFSSVDYLVLLDWQSMGDEVIYVVPLSKFDNDKLSDTNKTTNTNDLNSIKNGNNEQLSVSGNIQLIEYDVSYSIISDNSLSMDIDYNVYNGSSENDTVSLIAALYENGRLSDMKIQSLNVNALNSNTDSITLSIPNNHENYCVKLMVWEGLNDIKPIGTVKQVSDLDNYTREKYMYITSNANAGFNVYMNAATVKGANVDAVHTIEYDSSKISPVDLCGFTYNKELTAGEIANTDITIQNVDLSAGKIEYKFNLGAGRNTGITNLVKFKTLSDVTDETIIYTIQ